MSDTGTVRRALGDSPVLVADSGLGQNRAALAAVRALALAGHRPTLTAPADSSLAAASRHCGRVVRVPPVEDPGYAAAVRAELDRGYAALLPASDAALVALGLPGAVLVDKSEVSRRATSAGLPVLEERRFDGWEDLTAAAGELAYPLVVKPEVRRSSAQPPVQRADDARSLRALSPAEGPVVVQPVVDAPMSAVSGVVWGGRLVAVATARYLRLWPVRTGVASALETIEGDHDLEQRLLQVLAGHDGVFQAQLIGPYLIDLNPRVYGSLPLAVAAGANLPAMAVELAAGREVATVRARSGVRYRWWEGDLRHVLARTRSGDLPLRQAVAALRPRRGTAHSTESITDPGPALARLRYAITSRGARS